MKLKEIPRAAAFAWSPDAQHPTIVTGTAAGTIDADFSAVTALELWKLDLQNHSVNSFTAASSSRVETNARFHDVAFNQTGKVVVGALENGTVQAWSGTDLAPLAANESAHTGAVRAVDFSRHDEAKFATGGEHGQVLVWNVNDFANPFAPGNGSAAGAGSAAAGANSSRNDTVQTVQWNTGTQYILASGGSNGFARIWDTRRHREVLNLHYTTRTGSLAPLSCVQWHPSNSTKLATAALDDADPVVLIWDMKNVNKPEQVLRGHTRGVLTLDWCRQDPELMLSGGRDNQTFLWNPEKGTQLGAYPISVEWVFKTQFHPRLPDLFATASFDGKISVQTLQDTQKQAPEPSASQASGADFWESETVLDSVHPSFSLLQPPKWLQRPISAKFGFGGKLAVATQHRLAVHTVRDPTLDEQVTSRLKQALTTRDFSAISGDWDPVLQTLLAEDTVELPEAPATSTEQEDEDEFHIAPQYQPAGEFELLSSDVSTAILRGDLDSAVTKLIARDQPADALLVASYGSPDLVARAQNAYLSANAAKSAHLRAVWAYSTQNWADLIDNTELEAWPTVLKAVLASTEGEQQHTASSKVAQRLVKAGRRDDALRAVLAGRNASAAAALWLEELPSIEQKLSTKTTAFGVRVNALQQVVEKIAAACSKLGLPPATEPGADHLFSALRDYADLAAQQGDLELAILFLNMLPEEYAADKQRVQRANAKPAVQPAAGARPAAVPGAQKAPASVPAGARASPVRPTGLRTRVQPVQPAVPTVPTAVPTPAPPGSMPAPAMASIAQSQQKQQQQQAPPVAPPPSTLAAPFKGWNDVPELPIQPRRTRAAPAKVAPPPRQPSFSAPPVNGSPRASVSQPAPAPPAPPKAPNPYAPRPSTLRTSSGLGNSPYVPPAAPAAPVQRPYSRTSSHRVRAPPTSGTPPVGPVAASLAAPPAARAPAAPVAPPPMAGTVRAPAPPSAAAPPAAPPAAPSASASPLSPPSVSASPVPAPPAAAPASTPPVPAASSTPASSEAPETPAAGEIKSYFNSELSRVRTIIESQYPKQYKDTERRLQLLYSRLPQLSQPLIDDLQGLAAALAEHAFDEAFSLSQKVATTYSSETGDWFIGVQRLLKMSKGVPVA